MKFSQLADYSLQASKKTSKLSKSILIDDHINCLKFLNEFLQGNEPFLKEYALDTYKFTKCMILFCNTLDVNAFNEIFSRFKYIKNELEQFVEMYCDYVDEIGEK